MTFRVGQKVVCVSLGRGPAWAKHWGIVDAKVGEIYTVRSLYTSLKGKKSLRVVEIHNKLHDCGMEFGFYASRFRPVVDRPTEISIFTKMLSPQGVEA